MDSNRIGQEVYDQQLGKEAKTVESKIVAFNMAKNSFIKMNHDTFVASNIPEDEWRPDDYKSMIRPL